MNTHRLIEMEWPEFGMGSRPPYATAEEMSARLDAARDAMSRTGLTHLAVYGDREHFANIAWLTGFDPRFEECLLILGPDRAPLLVVGNECEDYVPVSPLYGASRLRRERFQSFSLLNQPRNNSRLMRDILGDEGIGPGAQVGCVGWKYFADAEHPDGAHALELPSYLADTLRALAGHDAVVNATAIFMHPRTGLRARCSATEIAYFEYTNGLASEGMKRMLFDRFGITLNAGHLIHLDEWLSSPIYPDSTDPIQSGMVIQSDVIPSSAAYASTRMEDGFAVADGILRGELAQRFPDLMARCRARRVFMRERLGFELAEEILPLSNIPGLVPPFLLEPRRVLAV